MVQDGLGLVGGLSVKSRTFAGTRGEDRGTLSEVRDGSRDPWEGSGRVKGPLEKVWDRLGQIGGPSERSETGRGTLGEVRDGSGTYGEVRDGSGDPRGG